MCFFIVFLGVEMSEDEHVRPTSPWMPFPILISVLSKVFPSLEIALICKFYKAKKVNFLVCFLLTYWFKSFEFFF
jgi:hypothetical protein